MTRQQWIVPAADLSLKIFNTDQGSQFTSEAFTGVLKRAGVVISMDGRGRAFDLYLCRASLAQRQAQGRVPQWRLNDGRLDAGADRVKLQKEQHQAG